MSKLVKFDKGIELIAAAERDLKRTLSDDERRDLLKDNPTWPNHVVEGIVEILRRRSEA